MVSTRWILIFFLWFYGITVKSQQAVFIQNPVVHDQGLQWGPNRTHFGHLAIGLGGYFPMTSESFHQQSGILSTALSINYRYRIKMVKGLHLGVELGLSSDSYRFSANEQGLPPFKPLESSRKRLTLGEAQSALFVRFRFGQRGDYLGNFLDLGAGIRFNLTSKYVIKTGPPDNPLSDQSRISYSGLKIIHPFGYQMMIRLGFDRFLIFGKIRFSELLNVENSNLDLPGVLVGLEYALVTY